MRLLLLDVAMPDLTFWTIPVLSCSILHLLFHLENVFILGSINAAHIEKDSKYYFHILLLQSATVGQLLLFCIILTTLSISQQKVTTGQKYVFGFCFKKI